ncbi:MAG: Acylphosphatase [Parcubacteria group bacterium GW2011_GWC1_45_13]|uniref:acylphosphatase n=3 Tax=Patescibacteria group TaxID=1783273 RepID=A0A0G1IYS0_9BACT|nr:MAG: Acylphosphatase [Candidatus Giovannonibacteria bacterium GW2011_GWB1_44_23]KKT64123.1 MAG: Acylphosphatase [Candidatus Giovannonibacteria bacterium GW2011_GWA1_44_29]KKT91723.1 MAG: Acylphosphatase [Parcubacteria group bacterium GW2011_GWC1_45_13]
MMEIYARVSGRVQMVMFRDFARRKARALGLSGQVKNLPDGSVEVVAQGEKDTLLGFIESLRRGPMFSRVEGVEILWREPSRQFKEFSIIY